MLRIAFVISLLLSLAAIAHADPSVPSAKCFATPERWSYDRDKETLAAPGERFFDDLRACDPTLAANITEAIRYQIQGDEAKSFIKNKDFVMAAWGAAWAILALSALAVWWRQRTLNDAILSLKARLEAEAAK